MYAVHQFAYAFAAEKAAMFAGHARESTGKGFFQVFVENGIQSMAAYFREIRPLFYLYLLAGFSQNTRGRFHCAWQIGSNHAIKVYVLCCKAAASRARLLATGFVERNFIRRIGMTVFIKIGHAAVTHEIDPSSLCVCHL